MVDANANLSCGFTVRQDAENLPGEFVARQAGSQELAAAFGIQTVLNLPGEFISRQAGSQNLPAAFDVNYWYFISHLHITGGAGMISGGTLDDTRMKVGDGSDLDLGEVGGAPGQDYEFHFLNVPADEIFGFRMLGFYDGNAAHIIKLYEWNFTLAQWDAVTNAVADILDAVVDQTYVWMAGGPDYVQAGEYRLRMLHPAAGNPVHETHWDYIWLDEDYAESEDSPPAHFIVRQAGAANLLGGFIVRHPGSAELGASFDGQVSLNLPGEFAARRSTLRNLAAGFIVAQGSASLPAELIVRQAASQNLLGAINIIHFETLPAELVVRDSDSEDLAAGFTVRDTDSQDLAAAFNVQPSGSEDLLGGFISRQTIAPITGVLIAANPRALFNFELDVGTGFTSAIKPGSDKNRKIAGESSMKVATRYEEGRYDYITFGWKYAASQQPGGGGGGASGRPGGYPGNTLIARGSNEFKGGFLVNQLPNVAAGLRDYTAAAGWQVFIEGTGDLVFNALIVPQADGTIDLHARAISTANRNISLLTYRAWKPTAGNPVTMVWASEANALVSGGARYTTFVLGALSMAEHPEYGDDTIELIYNGDTGQDQLVFHTSEAGQGEFTDLSGVWDPEDEHTYKIVWSTTQVQLFVDNVLRATHTTRVPDQDLHFAVAVTALNDQAAPDTVDGILTLHSFSPLS